MSTINSQKMDFGAIILRLMQLKGFTQEFQVAELLGYSRTAFSQRKKRGSIPVDKIAIICDQEGWDLKWILYGGGEGKRIQAYRMSLRSKVGEFAKSIGIQTGSLLDIENQKVQPSTELIEAIIKHTDICPEWLSAGVGAMRKGDYRTGNGKPFHAFGEEEVDSELLWKVLETIHFAMSELGLDPNGLSDNKRVTIRDLLYADAIQKERQPDEKYARILCELTYCQPCEEKKPKERWQEKWGIKPGPGLEVVSILVKAAPGLKCPMEGKPREYITDSKPVEVPCTDYYRKRVDDGSLIIIEAKADIIPPRKRRKQ